MLLILILEMPFGSFFVHFDTQQTLGPPGECGTTIPGGESPGVLGLSQRIQTIFSENFGHCLRCSALPCPALPRPFPDLP